MQRRCHSLLKPCCQQSESIQDPGETESLPRSGEGHPSLLKRQLKRIKKDMLKMLFREGGDKTESNSRKIFKFSEANTQSPLFEKKEMQSKYIVHRCSPEIQPRDANQRCSQTGCFVLFCSCHLIP